MAILTRTYILGRIIYNCGYAAVTKLHFFITGMSEEIFLKLDLNRLDNIVIGIRVFDALR